jgi:CubicO group peptidase (beta-lactamase class C family)
MTSVPAVLCSRVEHIIVETGFWGVVFVGYLGKRPWVRASGLADRAHGVANTPETLFAIASGTKTLTALAVMSLVAEGRLALDAEVQDVIRYRPHSGRFDEGPPEGASTV